MHGRAKVIILVLIVFTYIMTNFSFGNAAEEEIKVNIKDKIPYLVNGYEAEDLEIPEKLFNIISPEEILMRVYKKNDKEINLAIVISDSRDDLHAPEVCYRLQGFEFGPEESEIISNGCEISKIMTRREDKAYVFHFWYTDMKKVYKNRFEFLKNISIDKLLNKNRKKYALVIVFTDGANIEDLKSYSEEINNKVISE